MRRFVTLLGFLPALCCVLFILLNFIPPFGVLTALTTGGLAINLQQMGWQLIGQPSAPVVSMDSEGNTAAIATSNGHLYRATYYAEEKPYWSELPFPGDARARAYSVLTDGQAIYASDGQQVWKYWGSWERVDVPVKGAIRELTRAQAGRLWFVVGDSQILSSRFFDQGWADIWKGGPVDSNLALGAKGALVASEGRLWWHDFNSGAGVWNDVSFNLAGQPIRFVGALGDKWLAAATDTQVWRRSPDAGQTWEPFSSGLPRGFHVQSIWGDRPGPDWSYVNPGARLALVTDQGMFWFSNDGGWQAVNGFGSPTAFLEYYRQGMEGSWGLQLLASDKGVWLRSSSFDGLGAFAIGGVILTVALPLGLLLLILFGFIVNRVVRKRLASFQ